MLQEKARHMEVSVNEKEEIHPAKGVNSETDNASPVEPEDLGRERRLKWKIDLIILPLLALTYFLSSLVRMLTRSPHT